MTDTEADRRGPAAIDEATAALGGDLVAEPHAIGMLRRVMGDFARRHGARPDLAARIELAVSEAATNVVRHAYVGREQGAIRFAADAEEHDLQVVIGDDGDGLRGDRGDGLGFGLRLIASVTDDFAISARAEGGLEVWMRFVR
jgi:anti-sigma regulatory factor (Ser/Thr protein kinase)